METIKVEVLNNTGSIRLKADLYLSSGILKYVGSPATYSHVSAEIAKGKEIREVVTESKPEVKTEELIEPASEPRSRKGKKKIVEDN